MVLIGKQLSVNVNGVLKKIDLIMPSYAAILSHLELLLPPVEIGNRRENSVNTVSFPGKRGLVSV